MGDLIGESLSGNLVFINLEQIDKIRSLNFSSLDKIKILANIYRVNTLYMVANAGSGHIGSSFSSLDIMTYILEKEVVNSFNEKIFFSSKGHDAPGYYSALMGLKLLDFELLHKLRKIDGLPGHPDINTKNIVTNTGSLGMGISKAKGMILANRIINKNINVFVLTGDGELQEGQFWESLISAVNFKMHELTVFIDHNKLQSDTLLKNVSDLGDLKQKLTSFGWAVFECNGNSMEEIDAVISLTRNEKNKPKIIIANTIKGKGVKIMEHTSIDSDIELYKFHSGAPSEESYKIGVSELINTINSQLKNLNQDEIDFQIITKPKQTLINKSGNLIRKYSELILKEGENNKQIVVLDADLVVDTGLLNFKNKFPERFIEAGIAEQDMVSQAGGIALSGLLPIVHSFTCFLSSRPIEQIYNNATEKTKIIYVGSLSGIVPGGPGHSHQGVRDISTISSIPGMQMIEPSNEEELEYVFNWACKEAKNSIYIRLSSLPYIQNFKLPDNYLFSIGKGFYLEKNNSNKLIITYGPTIINETLIAIEKLKSEFNILVNFICLPWLNNIDEEWFNDISMNIDTIYSIDNHYTIGGQGDRIANLIAIQSKKCTLVRIGLNEIPKSGTNDEVLSFHKMDSDNIILKIKQNIL